MFTPGESTFGRLMSHVELEDKDLIVAKLYDLDHSYVLADSMLTCT